MSDVITTIPNPEEQASYPHDDEVSFEPSLQPAGDSSAENLLPGNTLATTKRASLLSRFKGKIFKRGNRGEPAFNMAPSPDHQANQGRSQLAAVIELQQRLVEEINRLKKHLAAAEANCGYVTWKGRVWRGSGEKSRREIDSQRLITTAPAVGSPFGCY